MLVRAGAPLAPLTTLRLGGPARTLVTAYDEQEVVEAVRSAPGPVLVLGGGTNVVLPDDGFDGTVVRVAAHGIRAQREGDRVLVEAAAGEGWDAFVEMCVAERLVGVEALSGIPGYVGASPIQNVGAYGQDVAQTCVAVRVYDRSLDELVTLPAASCRFSYRHSVFKAEPDRWIVLAVTYALAEGDTGTPVRYAELAGELHVELGGRAPVDAVRDAVRVLRRRKGMVVDSADPDSRSAGSFFTNPLLDDAQLAAFHARLSPGQQAPEHREPDGRTKLSAAWLVEQAGFHKGWGDGPVGVSTKHALALVNRGDGRTADLLAVARTVRDGVRERFGVELVNEPVIVGATL